jgi:hypothetical protein
MKRVMNELLQDILQCIGNTSLLALRKIVPENYSLRSAQCRGRNQFIFLPACRVVAHRQTHRNVYSSPPSLKLRRDSLRFGLPRRAKTGMKYLKTYATALS